MKLLTRLRQHFCRHRLLITGEQRIIRKENHTVIYRTCPECGREFKQLVVTGIC